MLKREALNFINETIMRQASKIRYSVADQAPSTEVELFQASSLVVWSGASDNTVFEDPRVNWAFRALHDALHLKTGLGFSHAEEVIIAKLQASQYESKLMRGLILAEVRDQALYHKETGLFVSNQAEFTYNRIKHLL